jgi:mitochondrial fission protein ELM1
MFKKYIQLLVVVAIFFGAFLAYNYVIKNYSIIMITNDENMGDRDQILSVANEIVSGANIKQEPKEFSYKDLDKVKEYIDTTNFANFMIISSNIYGRDSILKLKAMYKDSIKTIHLSHQEIENHNLLFESDKNYYGSDFVVLPYHSITSDIKLYSKNSKTKLIKTHGVCHSLSKEIVIDEYKKNIHLFNPDFKYLFVLLGGDTQMKDGSWVRFTKEEALTLAKYITENSKKNGYHVIVTNGPRTGKHLEDGIIDIEAHRGKTDYITSSFIDFLSKEKVPFDNYDFQYGKHNLYRAALGAILNSNDNIIFLPAESTSSISEILDLGYKNKPIVYVHSAITTPHKRHIKSEYNHARIKILSMNGEIDENKIVVEDHDVISAAKHVAKKVVNELF